VFSENKTCEKEPRVFKLTELVPVVLQFALPVHGMPDPTKDTNEVAKKVTHITLNNN
jgi:hypothetical protein